MNHLLFTDARTRSEKAFIAAVLLAFLVIPPLVIDCFPFSTFPMFSDAPQSLEQIKVFDGSGRKLSLGEVGIEDLYFANNHPKANHRLQRSPDASARMWRAQEFTSFVQQAILKNKLTEPILVQQTLFAPRRGTDGSENIQAVETRSWSVRTGIPAEEVR